MNIKKILGQRIRGWFPQEPKLHRNYPQTSRETRRKPPKNNNNFVTNIRFNLFFGAQLIILGIIVFFLNETLIVSLQDLEVNLPTFAMFAYALAFWPLLIAGIVGLSIIWNRRSKIKSYLRKNPDPKRLMPYGVSALILSAALFANEFGVQFIYAIPLAFLVSGFLVLKGLRKFAVTTPAFVLLILSMLFLGVASAGINSATFVAENRYLSTDQAPNVDTLNLNVGSNVGNIRILFSDNASQICNVAYSKDFKGWTEGHTTFPNTFSWQIEGNQVTVNASAYIVSMDVFVNKNLKLNLDVNSYWGAITIEAPTENHIQTLALKNVLGDMNIKLPSTAELQNLSAKSNQTIQANIISTGQNNDATVSLNGGQVKLKLDLTNVKSQIYANSTGQWGTIQMKAQGFTVIKENNFASAKTGDFDEANYKKMDIFATAIIQTPGCIDITASYKTQ